MTEQIHNTQTKNFLFTEPTLLRFPFLKIKLPTLLPKRYKRRAAAHGFATFPTSERETSYHPKEFPGIQQSDARTDSLDTLFLEAMRRTQPTFPNACMTQQKMLGALEADPELLNRFIMELLIHNDLRFPKLYQNRILELVLRHPDTTVKSTPFDMIIGLREGYQYPCDCDSFLPTRESLPVGGHLIERTLNSYLTSFNFQGTDLIEETILENGQEIKRWSIPLTDEEAIRISDLYLQKVE